MKFLKKFEIKASDVSSNIIEIGDFVLVNINIKKYLRDDKYMGYDVKDVIDYENFVNSTIGVVVDVYPMSHDIEVSYKNIPKNIEPWFSQSRRIVHDRNKVWLRRYDMKRIVSFSKTNKELKLKIAINKYNL